MPTTVTPTANRVVLRRCEVEQKGNIVLPDSAKEKPLEGIVVAAGPGKLVDGHRVPLEVSVGDHVYFAMYAGDEIEVDDEKLLVIPDDQILAIIKTSPESTSGDSCNPQWEPTVTSLSEFRG